MRMQGLIGSRKARHRIEENLFAGRRAVGVQKDAEFVVASTRHDSCSVHEDCRVIPRLSMSRHGAVCA